MLRKPFLPMFDSHITVSDHTADELLAVAARDMSASGFFVSHGGVIEAGGKDMPELCDDWKAGEGLE